MSPRKLATMPLARALGVGILIVGLAACSAPADEGPATAPATETARATPTAIQTVELDVAADAPQTYEDAARSAHALLLSPDELPGGGWVLGAEVASDDFRQTVCGVDTEPHPPAGSFVARRVTPQGLTLFQSIRPIGATRANAIAGQLRSAIVTCETDVRPAGTYTITPIPVSDPDAVVYQQERAGGSGITTFQVFLVQRDSLVNFTTFSTSAEAPTEFLDALISAARAKE